MKHLFKVLSLIFVFSFFVTNVCNSQTVGKIFAKDEADKLFGSVIQSVKISQAELTTIVSKTEKFVMFRVANGEATILGDSRKAIYPSADAAVGTQDVYHVYSKSLVVELLNKSVGDMVYMEIRKEVFSVTYGANTLEMSWLCPPICLE